MGIPVVLHIVIRSLRHERSDLRPSVSKNGLQMDDELFFFAREVPSLDSGAEIVRPPETAALAASP